MSDDDDDGGEVSQYAVWLANPETTEYADRPSLSYSPIYVAFVRALYFCASYKWLNFDGNWQNVLTRPLFNCFLPSLNTMARIAQNLTINGKSVDGVPGIQTQDRMILGADESTVL